MWRTVTSSLVARLTRWEALHVEKISFRYTTIVQSHSMGDRARGARESSKEGDNGHAVLHVGQDAEGLQKLSLVENVSRKDRFNLLLSILRDLKDSKESVYAALDAWVAWERNFPIASLKRAIAVLEKDHQWHRIIQVIKWMLGKGQGNTMATYLQLVRALDMDHRAEEAHRFWVRKIGSDLHSVPWQLCISMMSIYYRNNMPEHLIKLFKGLEDFDRKPPEKKVVQRVADAYELLGLDEEKRRILEKYNDLFTKSPEGSKKLKYGKYASKKGRESGRCKKSQVSSESETETQ